MKKFYFIMMMGLITLTSQSQTAVESNKFKDNWSIGLNVGGVTPLTHHAFFKNLRVATGITIDKQLTPVYGLSLEGMGSINTSASHTFYDDLNVSLLHRINLFNLFAGYKGKPRLFEMEAVAGIGWLHYWNPNGIDHYDQNSMSTKLGLNFNFNVGKLKAWTIAIKPALVYDMNDWGTKNVGFDANSARWEISAGAVYHFKTGNGKHYFTRVRPYDEAQINALNDRINTLRKQIEEKDNVLSAKDQALNSTNDKLKNTQEALEACKNQAPKTVTVTKDNKTLESIVTFRQGGITVEASQLPNVERIATYLKNHKDATVTIIGYASPEGSAEVNARIANQRAQAVKTVLMTKYHIAENRISAEGQGVGKMFEEADWNRVSICTINEGK